MIEYTKTADVIILTVKGEKDIRNFKELVHRATNLWPDAPSRIKELADKVSSGGAWQHYESEVQNKEDRYPLPPETKTYEPVAAGKWRQCKHCGCYLAAHYSPGNTCYPIPGLEYEDVTRIAISTAIYQPPKSEEIGNNPGE